MSSSGFSFIVNVNMHYNVLSLSKYAIQLEIRFGK